MVNSDGLLVDSHSGRLEGLQSPPARAEGGGGGRDAGLGGEYFQQLFHFGMDEDGTSEGFTS